MAIKLIQMNIPNQMGEVCFVLNMDSLKRTLKKTTRSPLLQIEKIRISSTQSMHKFRDSAFLFFSYKKMEVIRHLFKR